MAYKANDAISWMETIETLLIMRFNLTRHLIRGFIIRGLHIKNNMPHRLNRGILEHFKYEYRVSFINFEH